MSIAENIAKIKSELPEGVILLAATKTRTIDETNEAISAGIDYIGESKAQEAEQKLPLIAGVKKHFIGHLQSNKVKKVVPLVDMIQSVDSVKIAEKISDEASKLGKKMPVLVEINIAGEEARFGIKPEEAESFIEQIKGFKGIEVEGLMAMAPYIEAEKTRPYFKKMKEIFDKLKEKYNLKYLSIGMSQDYKIAVEEGSNMVRIGTAIFS